MTNRSRVVSTRIENGRAEISCYSDPVNGEQHVTDKLTYTIQDLPTPIILDLAAFGFAAVASNRYQRTDSYPDVPKVTNELWSEMTRGDWRPGKRDTGSSEPSDLVKAIAEATNTPVHVVAEEFETRMVKLNDGSLYKDKLGKTRRFFSASVQKDLAADPAIAPILARLEQERARATLAAAKANKAPSKLSALFASQPASNAAE